MLVGRDRELQALEERYGSGKYEFLPVYGRRRVGKTALLKEFAKGKNGVYFCASKGSVRQNVKNLSVAISGREYATYDFESVLMRMETLSADERYLVIIDEFPYMRDRDGGITGSLQTFLDRIRQDSKLFLILCGSSISMMEHEVLGYKSPLYGRRTGSMRLMPLEYRHARLMLDGFGEDDRMMIYAMVGGIPLYLEQFDPAIPLKQNIVRSMLRIDAFFKDEAFMTLIEEFESPATYYSVLSAVAEGHVKNADIATKSELAPTLSAKYLKDLVSIGVVKKTRPVDNPDGRMTRYRVSDPYLRFYFRHIHGAREDLWDEMMDDAAEEILTEVQDDVGRTFEEVCAQHLSRTLGGVPGTWWGADPVSRRQEEIDVVVSLKKRGVKHGYFAECKYRGEPVGRDVLDTLRHRSEMVRGYGERHLVLCSKSGFKDGIADSDAMLVTMDDIISGASKDSTSKSVTPGYGGDSQ